MIPYELGIPTNTGDELVLTDWPLQARERRALLVTMIAIFQTDFEQARNTYLFKIKGSTDIWRTKFGGNVELRPRCCCDQETNGGHSVTYLARSWKQNKKELPASVDQQAESRLVDLRSGTIQRHRYRPGPPIGV